MKIYHNECIIPRSEISWYGKHEAKTIEQLYGVKRYVFHILVILFIYAFICSLVFSSKLEKEKGTIFDKEAGSIRNIRSFHSFNPFSSSKECIRTSSKFTFLWFTTWGSQLCSIHLLKIRRFHEDEKWFFLWWLITILLCQVKYVTQKYMLKVISSYGGWAIYIYIYIYIYIIPVLSKSLNPISFLQLILFGNQKSLQRSRPLLG